MSKPTPVEAETIESLNNLTRAKSFLGRSS